MTGADPKGAGHPTPRAQVPSSATLRAAEAIRAALFDGDHPPGEPLREIALAESLGVSRSTVREALGVLVAEGLATHEPNRGTYVRRLDPEAVHDVCQARKVLESAGLRHWDAASEDARDGVRRALQVFNALPGTGCSPSVFTAAHLEVHRQLVALIGSERLMTTAESVYAEIRLALAHLDRVRGNAQELVHSHASLVALLEAGDLDGAIADLAQHLAGAEDSMVQAIGSQP